MTGGSNIFSPSSWNDGSLSSIFTKTYTRPTATYYPYTSATVKPAQPTSTANSTMGTHSSSPSGTKLGLKITLAVSICLGITCISLFIWLITRRLGHQRTLNKIGQPDITKQDIKLDNHLAAVKDHGGDMTFPTSGSYATDEKSSRPQIALPEKTCTGIRPITIQPQLDRNLIFELDSELYYYEQSEQGTKSDKHSQTNASNCHPRSVRSHRGVLQKTATCTISRSVHRKHLDAHRYSHRLHRFKPLQSNINPNHRLRVHCQRLPGSLLSMGVSIDEEVFLYHRLEELVRKEWQIRQRWAGRIH